jgi:hypothetical protein
VFTANVYGDSEIHIGKWRVAFTIFTTTSQLELTYLTRGSNALVKEGHFLGDEVRLLYRDGVRECTSGGFECSRVVKGKAEYSPYILDIEKPDNTLLQAAHELGVAVVGYSLIGKGILGGHIVSLHVTVLPSKYNKTFSTFWRRFRPF